MTRTLPALVLAVLLVGLLAAWEPESHVETGLAAKLNLVPVRVTPSSRGNRPPEVLGARSVIVRPTATVAASPTAGPVSMGVFRVTSYCEHGVTRSGLWTRAGIVAVDPKVIPLGTLLRIEGLPGEHLAADTGGGVLGKWIDLWLPTCRESVEWGSQERRVEVVR